MGLLRTRGAQVGGTDARVAGDWVARAFREACGCGVDPEQFWRLTPWQARIAAFGAHEDRATLAWLGAALERQKKMPDLERVTGADRERKDPRALKALIVGLGKKAKANG